MLHGRLHLLACVPACAVLLCACYSSSGGRDAADLADPAADEVPPDDVPDVQPDLDVREDPDEGEPDLPPDIVPPVTAEEYCMALASGVCGFFTRCCTPEEIVDSGASELGCEDPVRSEVFQSCMEDFENPLSEGTITVDREAMAEMREALDEEAAVCPGFGATSLMKNYVFRELTSRVLLGTLEEGQPCEDEQECLEELTCDLYRLVCVDRVREGGVCRDEWECDPGLVCLRGRCNAPADAGEPCAGIQECLVGLWCDRNMCTPLLTEGRTCDPDVMSCEGWCSPDTLSCMDFCDGI